MRCPSCGGETPAGKAFCADCGRPLGAPRCSACGAELLPGKAFCADCGHPVAAPAAATACRGAALAAATLAAGELPAAERRICSVLFVDLVGFTPLAERRDPEEVRELLSVYFARAQTIVGHYGGTVEKFIGDAVMAVWGDRPPTRTTPSEPSGPPSTSCRGGRARGSLRRPRAAARGRCRHR